jgi:hypothetical protein
MICLLADVGLRSSEPDLAFDPFERFETGFLTGRGLEGEVSFGPIPKMPIMGLLESLLGISFRLEQPAATYRARFCRLPIGVADIAGVHASNYEVLSLETSRCHEFSIDIENLRCCRSRKKNNRTFSELAQHRFRVSILVGVIRESKKFPARNRLTLLKKLFTGMRKRTSRRCCESIFVKTRTDSREVIRFSCRKADETAEVRLV